MEPVAIRIASEVEVPVKRFGLYTLGADGRPADLLGRFDTHTEVMRRCAGLDEAFAVEVAQYAFLKGKDFSDLFGPLPTVIGG